MTIGVLFVCTANICRSPYAELVARQFAVDGVNVGAEQTGPAYEVPWNTATVANGAHVVTVVARDAAGNQRAATVTVTVDNQP